MASESSAFHQLGRFIFLFQHIEAALTDLLVLMAKADDEAIQILVTELEFSKRIKTTDVMFARFVSLLREPDQGAILEFHKLMGELVKFAERRNELVHSKYMTWINIEGSRGLIRQNSALRASKGIRESIEEELLPEKIEADADRLAVALQQLENYRIQVIDWLYPDDT